MNTIEITNNGPMKKDFSRMKAVLACVSKDATRPAINKVRVEKDGDDVIVTTTDGTRLRSDRFHIKAEAGLYDIKTSNAKAIFMAQSNEGLVYPNHRQAFPSADPQHAYALNGKGPRFVLWAASALGCYVDPKLVALGEDEAVTLYVQKIRPNLSPVLVKNKSTTLVVMTFRMDPRLSSKIEAIHTERVLRAMEEKEAEALAA